MPTAGIESLKPGTFLRFWKISGMKLGIYILKPWWLREGGGLMKPKHSIFSFTAGVGLLVKISSQYGTHKIPQQIMEKDFSEFCCKISWWNLIFFLNEKTSEIWEITKKKTLTWSRDIVLPNLVIGKQGHL